MKRSSSGMIYNPYKRKRSGSVKMRSEKELLTTGSSTARGGKAERLKQAQIIQSSSRRSGSRPHTSRLQNSRKKSVSRPGSARHDSRSRAGSNRSITKPRSKSKKRARGDSATKNKFFSSLNSLASSIFNKKVAGDVAQKGGGDAGGADLRRSDVAGSKKFSNIRKCRKIEKIELFRFLDF